MWNDSQVKGFKPRKSKYRVPQSTNQRGIGRLVVEVHPTGVKAFFFQFFRTFEVEGGGKETKRVLLSLGRYKVSAASPGITLSEAREAANFYSALLQKGQDPEVYLAEKTETEGRQRKEAEAAKSRGTFEQLLGSYLQKLDGRASHSRVKQSFKKYVQGPFPEFQNKYANEITPGNIQLIIKKMIQAGITTQVNRTRSQLHAAFEHGIKHDNDPRRYEKEKVFFTLTSNPVASIPKQADFETVGEHVIKDGDIRTIWTSIADQYFLSGCAIKLAMTTGQRPGELIRLEQVAFNLNDKYFTIPAHISKNRIDHIVPLNDLALSVTEELLKEVEGASIYAFPGIKNGYYCEDIHLNPTTLSKEIREYCDDEYREIEKFIPRDIRRTWKTLAGKAGLSKEIRDRIQNHVIQDVSSKHYDKYDYMKEKQVGMKVWNDYLDLIIHPKQNVTRMNRKRA